MKKTFILVLVLQTSLSLFSQRVEQSVTNNNMTLSLVKNLKFGVFDLIVKDSSGVEKKIWNEASINKIIAVEGMQINANKCALLVLTWVGCHYLLFEQNLQGEWEISVFTKIRPFENGLPPFKYDGEKLIDMETIEVALTDDSKEIYIVKGHGLVKKQ